MAARKSFSRTRTIRSQLSEVVLHLRQIQSAVTVAVAALRQQNCDLDEDIAAVLQRSVADRVQDQIETLETVLRQAPLHPSASRARASHVDRKR